MSVRVYLIGLPHFLFWSIGISCAAGSGLAAMRRIAKSVICFQMYFFRKYRFVKVTSFHFPSLNSLGKVTVQRRSFSNAFL
jgi:hypothetical protein